MNQFFLISKFHNVRLEAIIEKKVVFVCFGFKFVIFIIELLQGFFIGTLLRSFNKRVVKIYFGTFLYNLYLKKCITKKPSFFRRKIC